MDNEKDQNASEIEQIKEDIKRLKDEVENISKILLRLGTELRNARDRGAAHAGDFLSGAAEGLERETEQHRKHDQ